MSVPVEDFKSRLNIALSCTNMRPVELAHKTGIPKSSISQYMSGYTKPKDERIYLISQVLGVSEAWLMGFDVPMERQAIDQSSRVTDLERAIIEAYFELPFEIRETVINHFVSRLSS